jgi:hypothetical protein
VTAEVLVDNQKTEVISHRIGAAVEYNARFLEVAAHYGFQPRACRPRRARTKGKDERMVRYIKEGESRGASQPRALAEPDMSLSTHPAPIIRPQVPGSSRRTAGDCGV